MFDFVSCTDKDLLEYVLQPGTQRYIIHIIYISQSVVPSAWAKKGILQFGSIRRPKRRNLKKNILQVYKKEDQQSASIFSS